MNLMLLLMLLLSNNYWLLLHNKKLFLEAREWYEKSLGSKEKILEVFNKF